MGGEVGVGVGVGVGAGEGVISGVEEGVGEGKAVGSGVGAAARTTAGREAQRGESPVMTSSTTIPSPARILHTDVKNRLIMRYSMKLWARWISISGMISRLSEGINSCTP